MSDQPGLYDEYTVLKNGEPVESCFVLEPDADPAARNALETYAAETDDDALAADLREWVGALEGDREVATDGGSDQCSGDIDQSPSLVRAFSSYSRATSESISSNTVPPHEHPLGLPMGSSVPSDFSLAAYGSPQSTHIAIPRFSPSSRLICSDWVSRKDKQDAAYQRQSQKRSLQPDTDRLEGSSQ